MLKTAKAFCCLKDGGHLVPAKILIRSMVETTLYAAAIANDTNWIWRKAFSEWREEGKLIPMGDLAAKSQHSDLLEQMKRNFQKAIPGIALGEGKWSAWDAANDAKLGAVYQGFYRSYCQYTHGTLRAMVGNYDEITENADLRVVCLLVAKLLELFVEIGVEPPDGWMIAQAELARLFGKVP